MDNQHKFIKGYKSLGPEAITIMNQIKEKGNEVGALIEELKTKTWSDERGAVEQADQRWLAIGKTEIQQGFMAVVRAITKPDFF